VNSELTDDFLVCFERLPERIRRQARSAYRIWKANREHPGIDFKRVGTKSPVYSVRVGIGWRALGLKQGNTMLWFWIGPHAEYDRLLKAL
jgi:murein DD-endopeptidase MepM/ murein hydrolase activator NlpD